MAKTEKRVWIVPENDLEANAIIDLLKRNGEQVVVTRQGWGATWTSMSAEEVDAVYDAFEAQCTPETMGTWKECLITTSGGGEHDVSGTYGEFLKEVNRIGKPSAGNWHGVCNFYPQDNVLYGIELQGRASLVFYGLNVVNIDHHCYPGDDRSNPKSSLEQVAEVLGVELNRRELFVAANDRGYIPAMEKLARELGIKPGSFSWKSLVDDTRLADRAAQGITPTQEVAAEEAIASKEVIGDLTVVRLAHSKCATVTDRLFGQYTELFIICGDGELDYFGPHAKVEMLQQQFDGFSSDGFWGVPPEKRQDPEEVLKCLSFKKHRPVL